MTVNVDKTIKIGLAIFLALFFSLLIFIVFLDRDVKNLRHNKTIVMKEKIVAPTSKKQKNKTKKNDRNDWGFNI